MSFRLFSSTALSTRNANQRILDVLGSAAEQPAILKAALGEDNAYRQVQVEEGASAFTVAEFARAAAAAPPHAIDAPKQGPVFQQSFRAYLAANPGAGADIRRQLQDIRDEAKKEKGFLSRAFGIFAHAKPFAKITEALEKWREQPLDAVMGDVLAFNKYCRKNRISFDADQQKLVAGDKPDLRFLIAAAGGAALGALGLNLGHVPVLQHAPAAFFNVALPWLAAPFIGLNVFKTFSETSIVKAMPTLGRFSFTTGLGFATSWAAVKLMQHVMPLVDPASVQHMSEGAGSGIPNPLMYMLPIMGGFAATALLRKSAEESLSGSFNAAADRPGAMGHLVRAYNGFNKAVNAIMRHPAPAILQAAKGLDRAADGINKLFPAMIRTLGVPAVATVLSSTIAKGGFGTLGNYAGYYATSAASLVLGAGVMLGLYKLSGVRNKDLKPVANVMKDAFLISSSSAVMPQEMKALGEIGVTQKTINTVTPLGGAFNMFGTSLYMGTTAMYGSLMFGIPLTPQRVIEIGMAAFAIAMGAPGVAASNITLLAPVMAHTGLSPLQIDKIYSMVLPADRPLDMAQTALNAAGDMVPAVHIDRKVLQEKYANEDALKKPKPASRRP